MPRLFGEGLALFLLPFAAFALFLVVQHRLPFLGAWTSVRLVRLGAAGLVLVILGLLSLGLFTGHNRGVYVPAHIDHGKLVPGRMS